MRRALILALGTALCAAPLALDLAAQAGTPIKAAAYKAPRNAFGQPDFSGYWSNSTLTPLMRPAKLGARGVMTPDEVKTAENAVVVEVEEGNAPTDPNAPADFKPKGALRPEFAAAGGDVGGYNRGWLDPGSLVMRVGGESTQAFTKAWSASSPRA